MSKTTKKVGDKVRFAAKVYRAPFAPFFDKYKGHKFEIKSFWHNGTHADVTCVDEPSLRVDGLVHLDELVKV